MKDIIFVSFEPGTRGHYIARVVASLPHVHWYRHPDNGLCPWNVHSAQTSTIRQRWAFANHFDRITDRGRLPPTWDYVDRFFPNEEQYYNNVFWPAFEQKTQDIDKTLVYCTHSSPDQLKQQFPTAKILSVVEPVETVVYKYVRTTAHFPGYIRMKEIVSEDNPWLQQLTEWHSIKKGFTFRDIWALENTGDLYTDRLADEYERHLYRVYLPKCENRIKVQSNVLPICMHPDWRAVKDFLLN